MLWTDLQRIVTRDGRALVGDDVRNWLEDRGLIPRGGGVNAEIVTNEDPRIVLRTREEIAAWLREAQLCKVVELEPIAVAGPRVAARGLGVQNRNAAPLLVEFVNAPDSQIIDRLNLVQGNRTRVAVRVRPAPKRAQVTLELSFIGAKIRSRAAVRSVRDSTTGYRYLSRLRAADGVNGIDEPLLDLNRAVVTRAYPLRKRRAFHYRIREFTLMGLEAGIERVQACLLDADGEVLSTAILQVTITRAPTGIGSLRVVPHDSVDRFVTADPDFDTIYAASPRTQDDVRVGICDSGVYDDSATPDRYLDDRWVAGKYFDSTVDDDSRDRDTKPGHGNATHVLDESPSMHGTNVAGQAMWGSPKIKLVDVMVQRGQETGLMTDGAAARAFAWAGDQGVCVVNCSKVMPFRMAETNAYVSDPGTGGGILFLATGGNTRFSFPLNNTPDTLVLQGEVNASSLPTSMENTLWVGGCKTDRSPHESRGFGPAIEVMVPSDRQSLYSPAPLREAFRVQKIEKFRTDLLAEIDRRNTAIVNPAPRIAGNLSMVKRVQLQKLEERDPALLNPAEVLKIQALQAERDDAPNPEFQKKQAYTALHAEIEGWPHDDILAWAGMILTLRTDLASDGAARASATVCVQAIQGPARGAVFEYLRDEIGVRNIISHHDALANVRADGGHIGTDEGVSFGLPVVANLVAKLKLINRTLTANQLKRVVIDTADIDPGFETQCIAGGIINPLRAYLAAFDNEVSTGGTLHHDYRPTIAAGPEPRRVYYTFFHMDTEGLALYRAIRQRLKDSYAAMDIDLIEAEPPVAIPNEPLTYVEGPAIQFHSWTKVVPVDAHPLIYPGRQLRLVLVNESALVIGNPIAGTLEEHTINKPADQWVPEVADTHKVTIPQAGVLHIQGNPQGWACALTIPNTPELARFTFVDKLEHIVTNFAVYSGMMPIAAGRPLVDLIEITRRNDREVWVQVIDPALDQQIIATGDRITFSLGVVQRIGGARKGRNIFVNNKYHAGPTGTPAAHDSALVLFQHEIGHALGMVNPVGHAHYYNADYGGEGDHCAFHTGDQTNVEAPTYGVIGDGRSGSVKVPVTLIDPVGQRDSVPCVMYHTRSPAHSRSTFCAECIRHLREEIHPATWRWNSDR